MSDINLLPESFRLKPSTVKTAELLKKISLLLFVVLVISTSVSVGLFFFYGNKINEIAERKNTVSRQIEALEETEQRLILVKDRLLKVKNIRKVSSTDEEIDSLNILIDNSNTDVLVSNLLAEKNSLYLEVISKDSVEILKLLNFIKDSGTFKEAVMLSLEYTPKTGFLSEMNLVKK